MANILIFEDDVILAKSWQTALEAKGHTVEHTANLETAIVKIQERRVDVAFVDIFIQEGHRLSPEGGLELVSSIHRLNLEQKPWIIAVSGRSHDPKLSVLEVAKDMGADDYLQKPIDIQALLSVVDRATL